MTAEPEPTRVPTILPTSWSWGLETESSRVTASLPAALSRGTIRRLWANEVQARVRRWVVSGALASVNQLLPQGMGTVLLPADRLLRPVIARLRGLAGPDLPLIVRTGAIPT